MDRLTAIVVFSFFFSYFINNFVRNEFKVTEHQHIIIELFNDSKTFHLLFFSFRENIYIISKF